MIFVGNDWAEGHHDVYLMDEDGTRLGYARIPEGIQGIARFHQMVAEHTSDATEVVVGIETDRGLWVAALSGAGSGVGSTLGLCPATGTVTAWAERNQTAVMPRC